MRCKTRSSPHAVTFASLKAAALTTWLTRIVMNAALMVRRKRKNVAHRFLYESDPGLSAFAQLIPDSQPNPELAYSEAESFQILEARFEKLNPVLREAVTMTYHDELSVTEASSVLGVRPSTYKARLFRGRRLLQKLAEHHARGHGRFLSNAS